MFRWDTWTRDTRVQVEGEGLIPEKVSHDRRCATDLEFVSVIAESMPGKTVLCSLLSRPIISRCNI